MGQILHGTATTTHAIRAKIQGNYSGVKNNNNLLIMNDFKYFSCFLQSKIGRVARL